MTEMTRTSRMSSVTTHASADSHDDGVDRRRAFYFALPPTLAALLPCPVVLEMLGSWRYYVGRPSAYLVIAPLALAVAAAPGYLVAAAQRGPISVLGVGRRWWLRLSLIAGLAASAVGLWAGTLMFLFAPPSFASLLCCGYLIWRLETLRRPTTGPTNG